MKGMKSMKAAVKEVLAEEDVIKALVFIRNYTEELIESLDIMSDRTLMRKIAKAEKEWKEKKTRNLDEFLKEIE